MKTMKRLSGAGLMLGLLFMNTGGALCRQGEMIRIPKNAEFMLQLLSDITSDRNKKGDEFDCRVVAPAEFAEATVSGHIANIKASGKANKKSEIALVFDHITMGERNGRFDAQVVEVYDVKAGNEGQADEEGTVKGKSRTKTTVKRAVIGAAIGAAIGGALGGGSGAATGAAIGAGAGAASTLVTEGPELDFKAGTRLKVRTTGRDR
jgi:uncharacterized protein YcfJ